jgi:hypothetical protein
MLLPNLVYSLFPVNLLARPFDPPMQSTRRRTEGPLAVHREQGVAKGVVALIGFRLPGHLFQASASTQTI